MSPDDQPHLVAAQRIYQAIRNRPGGWPLEMLYGRTPEWLGHAISSLVLALGDESVTFVSPGSDDDPSAGSVLKATVVGQTIIAELSMASDWKDDDAEFTVTARSLSGLIQLDVATDMHPNDTSGWGTWPGHVQLGLHFQHGPPIGLSAGGRLDTEDNQGYLELVRRLPSFLGH
jgi:hypothetical protein